MNLDTNTERGLTFRAAEALAVRQWESAIPGLKIAHSPITGAAPLDCVGTINGELALVGEIKCRTETMEFFAERQSYLITFQKVLDLMTASRLLGVPGVLAVYSIPDATVRVAPLCDCFGELLVKVSVLRSETRATCNGGQADRVNAYINWLHFKSPRV